MRPCGHMYSSQMPFKAWYDLMQVKLRIFKEINICEKLESAVQRALAFQIVAEKLFYVRVLTFCNRDRQNVVYVAHVYCRVCGSLLLE